MMHQIRKCEDKKRSLQKQRSQVVRSMSSSSREIEDISDLKIRSRDNLQAIEAQRAEIEILQSEIDAISSSQIKAQIVLRQLAQSQPETMLNYGGANLNSSEIDMCLAFSNSFSKAFGMPKEPLIDEFVKLQSLFPAVQHVFFAPTDTIIPIFGSIYKSILKEADADKAKARPTISKGITEVLILLRTLRDNLKFFGGQKDDLAFNYLLEHDNKHFMNADLLAAETGWSDIGENPDLPLAGSDHGSIGYVHADGAPVKESEQEKVSAAAIRAIIEDQIKSGGFEFLSNSEPFSFSIVPKKSERHGVGFADLKLRESLSIEGEEYRLDKALWLPFNAGDEVEPGKTQLSKDKLQEVPLKQVNELFFRMNFKFDKESNKWDIGGSIYPVIPTPIAMSAE